MVEVDLRKMEVVKIWTRPLSPTHIQNFLRLVGYYKGFFWGLLCIAFPLTTLNQKKSKLLWSKSCEKSFQLLKDRL